MDYSFSYAISVHHRRQNEEIETHNRNGLAKRQCEHWELQGNRTKSCQLSITARKPGRNSVTWCMHGDKSITIARENLR